MAKQNFETGFLLNRASFAMSRYLNHSFAKKGLAKFSTSFLGVMQCLWEEDEQNLTELSKKIALESSSMTGLIDRMERAQLVKRSRDDKDRRVWRVQLTKQGKEIEALAIEVIEKSYQDLTRGISLKEMEIAKKVLLKMIENSGYEFSNFKPKRSKKGGSK